MIRIDKNTVEFTEAEALVVEIFDLLLDRGHDQNTAVDMIFGCDIPIGLRTHTPFLDGVMSAEFIQYLRF